MNVTINNNYLNNFINNNTYILTKIYIVSYKKDIIENIKY